MDLTSSGSVQTTPKPFIYRRPKAPRSMKASIQCMAYTRQDLIRAPASITKTLVFQNPSYKYGVLNICLPKMPFFEQKYPIWQICVVWSSFHGHYGSRTTAQEEEASRRKNFQSVSVNRENVTRKSVNKKSITRKSVDRKSVTRKAGIGRREVSASFAFPVDQLAARLWQSSGALQQVFRITLAKLLAKVLTNNDQPIVFYISLSKVLYFNFPEKVLYFEFPWQKCDQGGSELL